MTQQISMKWPIISETWKLSTRITKVEYLKKNLELHFDSELCTACQQCIKACPKQVLHLPPRNPGEKLSKMQRMPQFMPPENCVFCGTCAALCPYNAISLKVDDQTYSKSTLPLVQAKILPEFQELKVGKYVLADSEFHSDYWSRISEQIVLKKK